MIDAPALLETFEAGLNPQDLTRSAVPATLLGYGEISAIFQIGDDTSIAYKRMPLFSDRASAERYAESYREYCGLLTEAGLTLPKSDTYIVELPDRRTTMYIAQAQLPQERFGHKLILDSSLREIQSLTERIVGNINKVWRYNSDAGSSRELAVDGQLSNWVLSKEDGELYYVDTSTPLYRKNGVEQLDPELLLQSAPGFLRWIIRLLFLDDVMNRYYDPKKVFTDLAANLYKEQRPDLVESTVEIINRNLPADVGPLTVKEIEAYYREDKMIWTLFLAFRRIDRLLTTKLLRKRYEFILPGNIKR